MSVVWQTVRDFYLTCCWYWFVEEFFHVGNVYDYVSVVVFCIEQNVSANVADFIVRHGLLSGIEDCS